MDQGKTSGSKRRNPGINVVIAMYGCLLPELLLTGTLRRIFVGVPYCGALLKLSITLSLNLAGSEGNLQVQKEGTQVCHNYLCMLPSSRVPPNWSPPLNPGWSPLLWSSPETLNYSQGKIYGPPSRPPIFGKVKYNREVTWYPEGAVKDRITHCHSSLRHGTHTIALGIVFQGLLL